ncbi:MAG: hypothetical protein R2726_01430 [Acidimicrobiales bacterium]
MDERQVVRLLAAGRVAVGGALVVAPGVAGRSWIDDAARTPAAKVVLRALGIRDLVLGAGALIALERGEPVREWVLLGAACDAVDAAATTLALRRLPLKRTLPVLAVALAAGALGLAAADSVD